MKNVITFTMFTLREAFSKKIVITFAAISSFVLLCFAIFFSVVTVDSLLSMNDSVQDADGVIDFDAAVFMEVLVGLEGNPRIKAMLGANPLQSMVISGLGDISIIAKDHLSDDDGSEFLEALDVILMRRFGDLARA